ncbi:pyrokinin-1 receptor-like [Parasteatoda tepidariorum]|uniref:pyrokinin-1 receptor-like n=1 Tax=Parasteatoda tepidariorum TaxID=114398 RepID=UPI00077F8343|nr:pyrokinin-1 receptor-like [Parasteatoda tepidariorum]
MAEPARNVTYYLNESDPHLVHLSTPIFSSEDISDNISGYVFDLGPKRDSLSSVIPITIIYTVILVTGLIGNICTCVVIIRNKHMRTVTNYYLFSLAISDLLLLVVGLPQELYLLWNKYPYVFGEVFCIIRGFASEMSTNASILTITSFTMERYCAICHPLRTHTMSKLSRAVIVIICVWIIGGFSAIHVAIQFGVVFQQYNGEEILETAECTLKNPLEHAFVSSTLVFFIIPMAIISVFYILIGIQLRASDEVSRNSIRCDEQTENLNGNGKQFSLKRVHLARLLKRHSTRSIRGAGASSRKAVIKMLFAVVVAFFLCWAPFHAQRLMAIYVVDQTPTVITIYTVLTHISGVTYYVSATINPILYSIMSKKFRHAFKNTLAHCCRRNSMYNMSSSLGYPSNVYRSNHGTLSNNNSLRKNKPPVKTFPLFKNNDWKSLADSNGVPNNNEINILTSEQ